MTTKVVQKIKYILVFSVSLFSIFSCEKDIESIGVNLVDNNNFSTNTLVSEVVSANAEIEKIPTSGVGTYLLGVYSDNELGLLKASIVTQLNLPVSGENYTYGTNPAIDSVIVSIPYTFIKEENYSDNKPQFSIDSTTIIGNQNVAFDLKVYELKTFLNTLDPENPSKRAIYYSNKDFLKGETPLYSGNFKVNPDDTVSYIKRYLPNNTVYDIDTIKQTDVSPTIKLPLNETIVKELFLDAAGSSNFASSDDFQRYFRGLVIEANELANPSSHLFLLNTTNAKMTIYYSHDENEGEGVDLNGNGTTGEQNVRLKKSYAFSFGNITTNTFKRDLTNSKASGSERLYLQGAGGSFATVNLFENEDLQELQNSNKLITGAKLYMYVDTDASSSVMPNQLFIYDYTEKLQLLDMISEGISTVGGVLENDEDGNPYRYVFTITDYVSELLKPTDPVDLVTLGIKVFNTSDTPANITDVKIKDFSWNPKGVVLFNHNPIHGEKRMRLEIIYSELNN